MIFLLACDDDSGSITEPSDESSSSVVQSSSSAKTKKSSSSSFAKSSSGKKTSSSSKKNEQSSSSTNRSSSSVVSSSSDKRSSSSVASSSARSSSSSVSLIVDPSTVVVDSIIDSRDGQTYKTVSIGAQTWMAQNLNYEMESSFCGDDGCVRYGRYYKWDAATVACPSGWHLPTLEEFETLFTAVGGKKIAAKALKSTSGWKNRNDGTSGNGSDDFGFSALPAGYRKNNGTFEHVGEFLEFWSSTEFEYSHEYDVYDIGIGYHYDGAIVDYSSRSNGYSVRCVKD